MTDQTEAEGVMERAEDLIERWRECSLDIYGDVTFRDTNADAAAELAAELRKGEELAKAVDYVIRNYRVDYGLRAALAAYRGSGG